MRKNLSFGKRKLESSDLRKKRDCIIRVAKTKALISCAVTAQLISAFVFAYVKIRFSHDVAHVFIHFNTNSRPLQHQCGHCQSKLYMYLSE